MRHINGKLLFVVPKRELVTKIHADISHLGRNKTLKEIREKYYFKNMRKYV